MATPLTVAQMRRALDVEGLTVLEYRDWETHNRNHMGLWGPVHGVIIHHTVTGPETDAVALCYNGHSALPGPLCHAVGQRDGRIYLVSNGRANHAGKGDGDVLTAVKNETALPRPNEADTDGNRHFYGIELANRGDGKEPWPMRQYWAAVRYAAALCKAHGWSERSVIGHKEWQPGKVDPTFDMVQFRSDVGAQLRRPDKPTVPVPAPPIDTGDIVQFTSLALTDAPETIAAGQSKTLYWDAEYQDGAGDHGSGGKTVVSGEHFTGTVALKFADELPTGVKARIVHELDAGGTSDDYTVALAADLAEHAFPYTGRVAEDRNMVVEIENTSGSPIVLNWAAVRGGTWAL